LPRPEGAEARGTAGATEAAAAVVPLAQRCAVPVAIPAGLSSETGSLSGPYAWVGRMNAKRKHQLFMLRTCNIFHSQRRRALEAGVTLDYTLADLRELI